MLVYFRTRITGVFFAISMVALPSAITKAPFQFAIDTEPFQHAEARPVFDLVNIDLGIKAATVTNFMMTPHHEIPFGTCISGGSG